MLTPVLNRTLVLYFAPDGRSLASKVPLGRMERPEDVATVIGFLASSKAGYMTGQAINVTGGVIMH